MDRKAFLIFKRFSLISASKSDDNNDYVKKIVNVIWEKNISIFKKEKIAT